MDLLEWCDLAGEDGRGDDNISLVTKYGEIDIDEHVTYQYVARVRLVDEIPCEAEVVELTRCIYYHDKVVDMMELYHKDFPHYIVKQIETDLVENYYL